MELRLRDEVPNIRDEVRHPKDDRPDREEDHRHGERQRQRQRDRRDAIDERPRVAITKQRRRERPEQPERTRAHDIHGVGPDGNIHDSVNRIRFDPRMTCSRRSTRWSGVVPFTLRNKAHILALGRHAARSGDVDGKGAVSACH